MNLHQKDSQLIQRYVNGDERSLEILIDRHNQRISSFIYSKIGDREVTEDIFQDTFIKVIRTLKRGHYTEEGKFLPWVMRIAYNLIIDHFRKHNRMPIYDGYMDFDVFSTVSDEKLNIESKLIKDQIDVDLVRMVEKLPPEQQEVVNMRIFKDMSFKEIAENTGVSINTALGRMRYALINLRKLIAENDIVLTN